MICCLDELLDIFFVEVVYSWVIVNYLWNVMVFLLVVLVEVFYYLVN